MTLDKDGVVIGVDQIYALLLSIEKKVDRVEGKVDRVEQLTLTIQRSVEDHEARLRSLENHGSTKTQDNEKEIIAMRGRLHAAENVGALNAMSLQQEHDERVASKGTMQRLAFWALGVAGASLATIVAALILGA